MVVKHSTISMFADDTKLYKSIKTVEDCQLLQEDLSRVSEWADMWQMELNPHKSKVLSIGNSKFNFVYMLKAGFIEKVNSVKDIGVTIQSNLKFTIHCTEVVRKAYFVIRTILNSFRNHDCTFYLKMYYHLCSTNFSL